MTAADKSFHTGLHPCAIDCFSTTSSSGSSGSSGNCGSKSYVACGCYELDEASQHRDGGILLYRCEGDDVEVCDVVKCSSGVLDLKTSSTHIFSALASETLTIHNIDLDENDHLRQHGPELSLTCEGEGLFLAVDYARCNDVDSRNVMEYAEKLLVSTQSGSIIVYTTSESGYEETTAIRDAHNMMGESMPVWTIAFNPHDTSSSSSNLIFSGGDDCIFRLWDLRSSDRPYLTNKSAHTAGVTSIAYHYEHEHIMTTGSYDESSLTWDLRAMKQPLLTIQTGGGVWRTKWITPRQGKSSSSKFDYLCTANMQGGSHVFLVDISTGASSKVDLQEEHTVQYTDNREKHLAYGIGMHNYTINDMKDHISFKMASCSFYDNVLDFWTASLPYSERA